MTKLQTKTSNLTLKIQKLAKGLNKFTINDILQLVPEYESEINAALKELENNNILKKVSATEYLYIKLNNHIEKENNIVKDIPDNAWLSMEEVCDLTGWKRETVRRKCKNKTYITKCEYDGKFKNYYILKSSITTPKVDPLKNDILLKKIKKIQLKTDLKTKSLFKQESEQKVFDDAPEYAKKYIIKYVTLLKLTKRLRGNSLRRFLKEFGEEHPEYKASYTTFMQRRNAYIKEGLKALIPQYGSNNRGKTILQPEMYEVFKNIYFSSNLSLGKCVEKLQEYGFNEDSIPSAKTFERTLFKEFSKDYIDAKKNSIVIPNLNMKLKNDENKKQTKKINEFEYFVDAANEYINTIKNSNISSDICQKGYILNHLIPYFKEYKFKEITQTIINNFQSYKLSQGFSIGSISIFMSTLSLMFSKYSNRNKNLNFTNKKILFKTNKKYLSKKQIKQLIEDNSPELWIICLGINPGELAALKYSDIDFKNKTVIIDKFLYKGEEQKHRKLHSIRTLKLCTVLFNTLHKKGRHRIFEDLQITNFDVLLNTHVKLLLNKNVPLNIICKNMGYKSLDDFMARFSNLIPDKLDDNFEII